MTEVKFIFDENGEISMLNEEGIFTDEEAATWVKSKLMFDEIGAKLLKDERIAGNEILLDNLNGIAQNYYFRQLEIVESLHNQILQLALSDTREDIEEPEYIDTEPEE